MQAKYKRILLKLSGEALSGHKGFGLDNVMLNEVSAQIKKIYALDVEIAVVVGGGNFWRGREGEGMDRPTADYMGMLATVMNALALQDELERQGLTVRVQSGITIQQVCEPYIKRRAERHLEKKRIVIFAGGTGNPFFTTDTAAALRAAEIEAEIILLAKNVDGVYDSDPKENPNAKKYDRLTFQEMIEHNLRAIDITAASLCKENNIPVLIFSLNEEDSIIKAVCGIESGTRLYNGEE